jgi:L,D-peptidoglycan transpeptidase YkuD (ErfK/YbiS/YcfS/YnhG family)
MLVVATVALLGAGCAGGGSATPAARTGQRAATATGTGSGPASPTSRPAASRTPGPPAAAGRMRPGRATPALLPDRMADTHGAAQLVAVTNVGGGRLEAFERVGGRWRRAFGPMPAKIGAQGFSARVSERTTATPIGLFTLSEAFGTEPDPGTSLPYRQARYGDVWVDDPGSPGYNTLQPDDADFSRGSGEQLWRLTAAYPYAVVIDYNRSPVVPGAGSAFFLHATIPAPSQGCVTIDRIRLVALLRWLRPAARPRIALGPLNAVLRM